jgi:hypothetical protein
MVKSFSQPWTFFISEKFFDIKKLILIFIILINVKKHIT